MLQNKHKSFIWWVFPVIRCMMSADVFNKNPLNCQFDSNTGQSQLLGAFRQSSENIVRFSNSAGKPREVAIDTDPVIYKRWYLVPRTLLTGHTRRQPVIY